MLPLIALLGALAWQAVVAGQAVWLTGSASRAAARAVAVGGDGTAAARRALPGRLEHGLRVRAHADGTVAVLVRVPSVVGSWRLGTVRRVARFAPQVPRRTSSR